MKEPPADPVRRFLGPVARAYDDRLRRYGPGPSGVFWRDEAGQRLRFDVLCGILDEDDRGFSVNDFGCGYGAMFAYLAERPAFAGGRYVGYDISDAALAAARQAHTDARARFVKGSTASVEADYSFASGTYNLKLEAGDADWAGYVRASLSQLWSVSRRGLAFNMLSAHREPQESGLFYAEPGPFVDFCLRRLSRSVTLLHDYPLKEWTIWVRR